jgi:hypothetical protein
MHTDSAGAASHVLLCSPHPDAVAFQSHRLRITTTLRPLADQEWRMDVPITGRRIEIHSLQFCFDAFWVHMDSHIHVGHYYTHQ